ncbi:hypothetical protein V1477_020384 [Vespula maculifrons]|uniref:Uncharacterized protein n=1 Tax=Vespula maculifrons TaxID=7453 RepID=A0ABD2ALT9_VESMC
MQAKKGSHERLEAEEPNTRVEYFKEHLPELIIGYQSALIRFIFQSKDCHQKRESYRSFNFISRCAASVIGPAASTSSPPALLHGSHREERRYLGCYGRVRCNNRFRAASPAPSSRAQITDNHSPGAIVVVVVVIVIVVVAVIVVVVVVLASRPRILNCAGSGIESRLIATDDDEDDDDDDDDNDDDNDDDDDEEDDDDDDDDDKFLYAPLYACIFIGIDVKKTDFILRYRLDFYRRINAAADCKVCSSTGSNECSNAKLRSHLVETYSNESAVEWRLVNQLTTRLERVYIARANCPPLSNARRGKRRRRSLLSSYLSHLRIFSFSSILESVEFETRSNGASFLINLQSSISRSIETNLNLDDTESKVIIRHIKHKRVSGISIPRGYSSRVASETVSKAIVGAAPRSRAPTARYRFVSHDASIEIVDAINNERSIVGRVQEVGRLMCTHDRSTIFSRSYDFETNVI